MFPPRKEPGDFSCEKFLCLCLTGVSLCPGALAVPLLGSVAGIPFPSGDYGLQQSIGSTPRKPPHFLFLPQLLSLCWEYLQAAKTTVVRARREQTGILPSPGSQRVPPGSHLGRGSPRVGIPHPPGEGGRKGKHNPPPSCFSCSSREPFQHTLLWL